MNKPEKSNANSPAGGGQITAVALGLLHGLLWAGVLYGLVFVIPRYTAMFEDFDTQLPTMTLLVVYASRLAVQYWYLFVLAGLAALDQRGGCPGDGVEAVRTYLRQVIPPLDQDRSPGPDVEQLRQMLDSAAFQAVLDIFG